MNEKFDGGKLAEELRSLVEDAEALLRASAGADGAQLNEHAQATLAALRGRLAGLEQSFGAKARDVDTYVRDNPWQAVAITGGIALLLGLIMGRR